MPFVDTHCHLDVDLFDSDRLSVMQRCRKAGLSRLILPGVTQYGWKKLLQTAAEFPEIFAAPGLHPCFIKEHRPEHLEELREIAGARSKKVIAVGEAGLDYFDKSIDPTKQAEWFAPQVKLAGDAGLPLLLHVRKAHDEVMQIIRKLGFTGGGIVHCYSGSLPQAQRYIDHGFKLGIGGVITYGNARRLHEVVRQLPLTSFVLETDAPDIPPAGFTGPYNTPENLPEIFSAFCRHRTESPDVIKEVLYRNTLDLFPGMECA